MGGTEVRLIALENLREDHSQPRDGMGDRAALEALKDSMARLGRTVQHVTVNDRGDGTYTIVSGHRRVQAAAELGWDWLAAVVVDDVAGDVDRLLGQLAENCARSALRPVELCEAVAQLRDRVDPPTIAEATGLSVRTVYNYLSIIEHPDLVDALRTRSLRWVLAQVAARNQNDPGGTTASQAAHRALRSVRQLTEVWPELSESERAEVFCLLSELLGKGQIPAK